ncbi:M14/M99 family metallopeptidase [Dethiosulfatarculus sandiegensis]|uniref:D,L-carboxypeptidase peptidase domain-containing protein n=1 Tax=Dethiosulfatarculus sandiegensis TaxID=1429043 RepID=A0A0D2GGQ2_9BACT|nr:M14/M99 family metallopeptidase [Dethiosulfatarculus sandiegensis]KIX14082.1 hypothetical protein X474_10635 [Dethiosulfatarculus sandiegensis]
MKPGFWVFLCMFIMAGLLPVTATAQKRPCLEHRVYFDGTPNQLDVYHIRGTHPGKTLMILGGIQGDEPGGFLSADLYADIALIKGDLIVVPRANLYSIIKNHRGPDGDMNRQFGDPVTARRHKEIVSILKKLIAQSDCLLNLHDGSGFFRPKWEGPMANPKRYGQSLIADTDVFVNHKGKKLDLKGMAEEVLAKVNLQIKNPKYHLLFNNHATASPQTLHKEQRRSATYYALMKCGIPAFGVESSKSLPTVGMKVRHHILVINAFMDLLGIERENPASMLPKPVLQFVLLSVNGKDPVMVSKNRTLAIRPGDKVKVLHIEANYERGLTCDFLGVGSINDLRRDVRINKSTTLVVRKDNARLGNVKIRVLSGEETLFTTVRSPILYFLVEVEGQRRVLANGEELKLIRGDNFKIVDVLTNLPSPNSLTVNLKGFVPAVPGKNQGEDRGYEVRTARDLMSRFSHCPASYNKDLSCHRVLAKQGNRILGEITVVLRPAKLDYLVLKRKNGGKMVYHDGESVRAHPGEKLEVVDLKTNLSSGRGLTLALHKSGKNVNLKGRLIDTSRDIFKNPRPKKSDKVKLVVLRADQTIGHIRLDIGEK